MAITIKKVSTKRELKKFIRFNYRMYKGNPYSVPDLYDDMLNTFNKKKNAAFEFCEADYFLAYRDDKIVGRVAAIINNRANEKWECKNVRFGWIDFIDDPEVSSALIKTVEDWGKERGMTHITGPLGFTDFDAEGMLIEGFDQLSTMATIYNHPYYPVHMERLGFEKDADWVEYKIYIPDAIPDKHKRISELIQRKYNLKIKKYTSGRKIAKDYGQEIFELMNEAYSPLYGYSPLTQRQINQYVKMYLPILDLRMVTLITDADDKLVCVGISMPSLAEALQKSHGRLLPLGWFYLLKALFMKRRAKMLDLLLVAVKPEEQTIFEVVEQMPEFPNGGMAGLMQFLSKNIKYPTIAQENGTQGRVTVQFVVNKDGSIVDAKVIRGVDPYLDKEALRVIGTMPKWKPGMQRGKPVRVKYTVPVMFRLQ